MIPRSDHFDGRRFHNPTGPLPKPFTAVPRLLMERGQQPWPRWIDGHATAPPARNDDTACVTFVGHATFLIQTADANILTDPMYSMRAGPWNLLGPRRVRRPAVSMDDLPPISLVLLSHNHYDHCDLATLGMLAERFDPLVVTLLGNRRLVERSGVRRVEELDWWQASRQAPLPVTATPAHHFSARHPFDRNRALWGGFVIEVEGRRIFFAGDTAYTELFTHVRARLGAPDLALIPIGAYEPRWFMRAVHMNPAEAVQAHVDLAAAESVAMHYGTFPLTIEPIDEPIRALDEALRAHGLPSSGFRAIDHGASVRIA
jgi:L-ascorbate metabolism protein UlaG (beta-lactamase superfamily)